MTIEPKPTWEFLRTEVQAFAVAMEIELRANDWKEWWKGLGKEDCLQGLMHECEELQIECRRSSLVPKEILREAADVANFAMFIADVSGGLQEQKLEARGT